MRLSPLVVGLTLSGCFSSRRGEIETARQTELARVTGMALAKLISPDCTESPPTPEPPGTRPFKVGERTGMQPCGLVAAEILAPNELTRFVDGMCAGREDATCDQRLLETFMARLRERYVFADWTAVDNKCTAHPLDCRQWLQVELWAIDSHNEGVVDWNKRTLQQTNDRYAAEFERAYAEEAEHRQRIGAALGAFSSAMSSAMAPTPTVHCTSNTVGITTTTSCH
jgi:hypothetical protein